MALMLALLASTSAYLPAVGTRLGRRTRCGNVRGALESGEGLHGTIGTMDSGPVSDRAWTAQAHGVIVPMSSFRQSVRAADHLGAAVAPPAASKLGPVELLRRYGGAYLLVSISMSAMSFALCYLLVSRGLDVRTLLLRFGLRISTRADAFSTIGLACMPIWLKPRNWQRTAESATTHAFRPHFWDRPCTQGGLTFALRANGRSDSRGRAVHAEDLREERGRTSSPRVLRSQKLASAPRGREMRPVTRGRVCRVVVPTRA